MLQLSRVEQYALRLFRMHPVFTDYISELKKIISEKNLIGSESDREHVNNFIKTIKKHHETLFNQKIFKGEFRDSISVAKKFFFRNGLPRFVALDERYYEVFYGEGELAIYIEGIREISERSLMRRMRQARLSADHLHQWIDGFGLRVRRFVSRFEGIEYSYTPIHIEEDGSLSFNLAYRSLKGSADWELFTYLHCTTEMLIKKCQFILKFFLHIAGYDFETFLFLLKYAFALHYLGDYKLPALVLYSRKRGVGKSTFIEEVLRLVALESFSKIYVDDDLRFNSDVARSRLIAIEEIKYTSRTTFNRLKDMITSRFIRLKQKYELERTIEFGGVFAISTNSARFVEQALKERDRFAILNVDRHFDHFLNTNEVRKRIAEEIVPFLMLLRRIHYRFGEEGRFIISTDLVNSKFKSKKGALSLKEARFLNVLFDPENGIVSETEKYFRFSAKHLDTLMRLLGDKYTLSDVERYLKSAGFKRKLSRSNGSEYAYYILEKSDTLKTPKERHVDLNQAIEQLGRFTSDEPILSPFESLPEKKYENFSDFVKLLQFVERNKPKNKAYANKISC
jgi:hypothetical protein